jgi:hypothetical protein
MALAVNRQRGLNRPFLKPLVEVQNRLLVLSPQWRIGRIQEPLSILEVTAAGQFVDLVLNVDMRPEIRANRRQRGQGV